MSIYQSALTRISNPQISNISIAVTPGLKFRCSICKKPGEGLFCLCNKCKEYIHPSCTGVKIGTAYGTDGNKYFVLPASENLPKYCCTCLTEAKEIMMTNQLYVQQRSFAVSSSSSSITSFLELGMAPAHKLIEEDGFWMVHKHIPGHQLKPKNNSTNYNCSGCKIEGFGLYYGCENSSCSFILHPECMSPRKTTKHWFFPNFTFAFSCLQSTSYNKHSKKAHTSIFCDACGLDVNGYFYHSLDGKINLHPCCIKLPNNITCGETRAKMVLQQKPTSNCYQCHGKNMKLNNGSNGHVWSYVSVGDSDNVHLHIGCLIKMLTEQTKRDSIGRLISCEMSCEKREGKMKLVLQNAKFSCKTIMKYARIALGAIIAALTGDATTLIVSSVAAFGSR